MLLAALAVAAQAATPAPAPAPPRITMPSISLDAPDWELRRARGSCATTVALSGGGRLILGYHGGQLLVFVGLVDPALGLTAGSSGDARVRFGPLPEEPMGARVQPLTENGPLVLSLAPTRYTGRLRALAETGNVTIAYGGHAPVTYAVAGAREGVQRLLACGTEVRAALPPAEQLPRVALNTYFSTDDYPGEALRERQQGTVSFWVRISPEGRVSDCRIIQSSGSPSLDAATCRIIRERARYTPARDAQGRPAEAFDGDYAVTWRLP
jgi:TonB family protein